MFIKTVTSLSGANGSLFVIELKAGERGKTNIHVFLTCKRDECLIRGE